MSIFHNHEKRTEDVIKANYDKTPVEIKNLLHRTKEHDIKDMVDYLVNKFLPREELILTQTSRELLKIVPSLMPAAAPKMLLELAVADDKYKYPDGLDEDQKEKLKLAGVKYKRANEEYFKLNNFLQDAKREYQNLQDQKSGCSVARCLNSL